MTTYFCHYCEKTWHTHYSYQRHRRTHRGEPVPPCSECGKEFSSVVGLARHKMHHADALDRFFAFVAQDDETGCWEWQGCLTGHGYGQFPYLHKNLRAHRWGYEQLVGPIPDGLVLDHLCLNTKCVNPGHLEPVTQRENTRRAFAVKLCKYGHEFTPENTRIDSRGHRRCIICLRARAREEYRRRVARRKVSA